MKAYPNKKGMQKNKYAHQYYLLQMNKAIYFTNVKLIVSCLTIRTNYMPQYIFKQTIIIIVNVTTYPKVNPNEPHIALATFSLFSVAMLSKHKLVVVAPSPEVKSTTPCRKSTEG